MAPNPSYDDLSVFFASYAELSVSYDEETSSYHGGSNSDFGAFLPPLRDAPVVIATLVSCGHLPTSDDLELMGMANGGGDFIFNALCIDSDSDLSPLGSDDE